MRSVGVLAIATLAVGLCLGDAGAVTCSAESSAASEALRADDGTAVVGPGLDLISSLDARDELLARDPDPEPGRSRSDSGNYALVTLASLVVPGSGQLIKGENRGYLYMLAEAALWGGFFVLDQKGMDERADYERFADENWDSGAYYEWFTQHCSDCSPDEPCGPECRPLAEAGTQEYYEDIGKYKAYWGWWSIDGHEGDWLDYSDADKALRDRYYEMRGESNLHLRQARYAVMAALLNHVVSAVDAFLTSRGAGSDVHGSDDGPNLEFDVANGGAGLTCALVSRY